RILPFTNRFEIDKIGSNSQSCRTGVYEICSSYKRHTARRNELDLRQWSLQRFEITRTTNSARREHLYEIGARIPRLDHLGRRQRTRHHRNVEPSTTRNRFEIQRRTHHEPRSTRNTSLRYFRIEHGSSTDKRIFSITLRHLLDYLDRARHSHRNLEHRDSTFTNRIDRAHGLVGTRRAHHRDHARVANLLDNFRFSHIHSSTCYPRRSAFHHALHFRQRGHRSI